MFFEKLFVFCFLTYRFIYRLVIVLFRFMLVVTTPKKKTKFKNLIATRN